MSDRDYRRDEPGILHALRVEAARAERHRILDLLANEAHQQRRQPGGDDRRKTPGRTAAELEHAIELIDATNPWVATAGGELHAAVNSSCDSVEVYGYDPDPAGQDGEEESMPVRLVTVDGAESTVATAYLTLDEAALLAQALTTLVEQIRAGRATREPTAVAP